MVRVVDADADHVMERSFDGSQKLHLIKRDPCPVRILPRRCPERLFHIRIILQKEHDGNHVQAHPFRVELPQGNDLFIPGKDAGITAAVRRPISYIFHS